MQKKTPHKIDLIVGNNLRALRLQRRFTQAELADALGVTFQQVQKYEKGANRISASKLFDIAQFFDIGVSSFYEGTDDKEETASILPVSRDALDVAFAMDEISNPKVKKQIKQLVLSISTNS